MFQFLTYPMLVAEDVQDPAHRFTFTSPDFTNLQISGPTIVGTARACGQAITATLAAGTPAPTPTTLDTAKQRVVYVVVDHR
ncbi:hypothetical protein ACFQ5J_12765 [Lacticaseibacillus baoqingensis]|uniref:Uncharacterized protein n=1 Tax=Lacticaseibacillus baoqingensis TaxID=2486013 RepID=A0ABW4E870_9LACO|nr:hypothetical protein [Lacticaseibacillus baoqingensis]